MAVRAMKTLWLSKLTFLTLIRASKRGFQSFLKPGMYYVSCLELKITTVAFRGRFYDSCELQRIEIVPSKATKVPSTVRELTLLTSVAFRTTKIL